MKKNSIIIALLLLTLLVFTACTIKPPVIDTTNADVSTLLSARTQIETLDTAYKTNWHEETIPSNVADANYATQYALAMQPMIDKANATGSWQAYQFLSARQLMLETEANYSNAQKLDPRPLAEVVQVGTQTIINATLDDFDCKNADNIKQATILYADVLTKGQLAIYTLDNLMQYDVPAREIIGLKNAGVDKRPKYYVSKMGKVLNTIKINSLLLEKLCEVQVGKLYKSETYYTQDGS